MSTVSGRYDMPMPSTAYDSRGVAGVDGTFGIGAYDVNVRILLLQIARRARDRAARSDARDEVRDAAGRLFPNLRAGRMKMRFRIVMVMELIRLEGTRRFRSQDGLRRRNTIRANRSARSSA